MIIQEIFREDKINTKLAIFNRIIRNLIGLLVLVVRENFERDQHWSRLLTVSC